MDAGTYSVRPAAPADGPSFLGLLEELAVFEQLDPPSPEARQRILADAFGATPRIEVLIAEHFNQGIVAYAILLHTYSSFLAKPTLYIEDVYVQPSHRGTGLADRIMAEIAKRAKARGCARIEGVVLDWNKRARAFYRRTGAQEKSDWILFRYDEAQIERLDSP